MKKTNYWKYIILSLVVFVVLFHVGAIIYIQNGPKIELTQSDYYEKGQQYEVEIQAIKRGRQINWLLEYHSESGLKLTLAQEKGQTILQNLSKVNIALERPNDSHMDQHFEVKSEGAGGEPIGSGMEEGLSRDFHVQKALESGLWRVRMDFEYAGQSFLRKTTLVVP